MILRIAILSLINRKSSVLLTLFAIVISLSVLISVEHIRVQAKESFNRSVSGIDVIVGARTSPLNLLLFSVFGIGNASNNINTHILEEIEKQQNVDFAVPISLGDTHKGYRIVGTTPEYFDKVKFGYKQSINFLFGAVFTDDEQAVIGSQVAKDLGYSLQQAIVIGHGSGKVSFHQHDNHPFTVVGILAPTGTPIDRAVYVSLEGVDEMHGGSHSVESSVTAVFVGLKSKFATLGFQRDINQYSEEALSAILPGFALAQLWSMLSNIEQVLLIISGLVFISALLGLATMLLANMHERKTELAVLRIIGARPISIFMLIQIEALLISLTATAISFALVSLLLYVLAPQLAEIYGVYISVALSGLPFISLLSTVFVSTVIIASIPAIKAYRQSLSITANR